MQVPLGNEYPGSLLTTIPYARSLAQVHSHLQKHRWHGSFAPASHHQACSASLTRVEATGHASGPSTDIALRSVLGSGPRAFLATMPLLQGSVTALSALCSFLASPPSEELLQSRSTVPHLCVPRAQQSAWCRISNKNVQLTFFFFL